MSGFPNLEQIATLRDELEIASTADNDIARLNLQIKEAKDALTLATEKRAAAMRAIDDLLASMDCRQTGNTGYENRRVALLKGLAMVAERYGRTHQ